MLKAKHLQLERPPPPNRRLLKELHPGVLVGQLSRGDVVFRFEKEFRRGQHLLITR